MKKADLAVLAAFFGGLLFVVAGLAQIYAPLAWLFAGAAMVALAVSYTRHAKRPAPARRPIASDE